MANHRVPPQNLEAEMSVLGAVFLEPDILPIIATELQPDDFYKDGHRRIYTAMCKLSAAGDPVDLISMTTVLSSCNELDKVGGHSYLVQLVEYVPTASNVNYYCRQVREKAVSRRVIQSARDIAAMAYESADPDQLLADSMGLLETVGRSVMSGNRAILTLDQMADIYEDHVKNLKEARFTTGWPEVDAIIRGVAPGEVLMLIGYSGLFKSAHLHNMLLNACARENARHNLFFSLEMPATRVFQRTVQISLEHVTHNVESGFNHHSGYKEKVLGEMKERGVDKLLVCEEAALTIERIEYLSRLAKHRFGNLGAIGIDYLGLMSAEGSKGEYERISYVAENSKHMAKRLNLPVIMLTQVNRASASEGELKKWSAKGSGAVEASADYMLGLNKKKDGQLQLEILKNRNGEEEIVFDVDIEAKYLKVRSMTPANQRAKSNVRKGFDRSKQDNRMAAAGSDPY